MHSLNSKIAKYTTKLFLVIFLCSLNYSCIRDNLDDCGKSSSVILKVVDVITGEDITTLGEMDIAELYLFDENQQYIRKITVNAEDILEKRPIQIFKLNPEKVRISVWGNRRDNQSLTELESPNSTLQNSKIELLTDKGYAIPPDDLFFGFHELKEDDEVKEIAVSRKNALMHITVRGLQQGNDDDYYFIIKMNNNGYDFRGIPGPPSAQMMQSGIYNANGDFITPEAFKLIHAQQTVTDHMTVSIYKRAQSSSEADELISTAYMDINGNPISPPAGYTTNILFDIEDPDGPTIQVELTPWKEIYQWGEW